MKNITKLALSLFIAVGLTAPVLGSQPRPKTFLQMDKEEGHKATRTYSKVLKIEGDARESVRAFLSLAAMRDTATFKDQNWIGDGTWKMRYHEGADPELFMGSKKGKEISGNLFLWSKPTDPEATPYIVTFLFKLEGKKDEHFAVKFTPKEEKK